MKDNCFVNTKQLEGKENYYIDVLKFVLSFFIIGIHTPLALLSKTTDYFLNEMLFRVAVPLYFFIAGYYLFSKVTFEKGKPSDRERKAVRTYLGRILFMFVFWSAAYLPFQINGWIKEGNDLKHAFLIYFEYVIARGDSYKQLWYLAALFTAAFLVYELKKHFKAKTVFIISIGFFFIGLLLQSYYCVVKGIIDSSDLLGKIQLIYNRFIGTPRSGLFFGFIFVAFGGFCAQKGRVVNLKISIIGVALSSLLAIGEGILLYYIQAERYCALQISHIFLAYFVFLLCNNLQIKTNRAGGKNIRKLSSVIYCIHPLFILIIPPVIEKLGSAQLLSTPLVYAIICAALSAAAAFLWVKLEAKKGFGFLKKLH